MAWFHIRAGRFSTFALGCTFCIQYHNTCIQSQKQEKQRHVNKSNLLLLLPNPFRAMGAWRKTMEPQKPGNSPGPGPEVVERERIAKERATQRVCSWTVQNETKGVLGRVSAGTAGRILDSDNPRKIRA